MAISPRGSARTRTSFSRIQYNPDPDEFEEDSAEHSRFIFSEKHKILQLRLQPLFRICTDLETCLGSEALQNREALEQTDATPFMTQEAAAIKSRRPEEFFVTTQEGWRRALDKVRNSGSATRGAKKDLDDSIEVLAGCGNDIKQLWADEVVQSILSKYSVQLEHSSGL
jgi:hypothetical protein